MRKQQVNTEQFIECVFGNLELLMKKSVRDGLKNRVLKLSNSIYMYKDFRFELQNKVFTIRYIKCDRESYFKVYELGRSHSVKSYFYKTSLLLNNQIDTFCELGVNEFQNRG